MTTIPDLVERAVTAMAGLVVLGETIQEEWTYVHDLELVWVARLRAVAVERSSSGPGGVDPAALEAAIARLCDETSRITDPHRAIDWLSTLPQATLIAIGEAAW